MKNWMIVILCWFPFIIWAQNSAIPALERNISIDVKNQPVAAILTSISMQAGCVFSYNPDAINSTGIRSINLSEKPVRQALNLLFDGNVQYKERGKYVILKKAEDANASKKGRLVEGYVIDAKSGQRLTETSIYDKQLLTSTITDKYGYFRLEVPADQHKSRMHISKMGYTDTLITPLEGKTSFVNIELSSNADINFESFGNSSDLPKRSGIQRWLISKNIRINTRNVTDTIFKNVQISLLPFVSTNKLLTGSTVNKFSLNLTVGFIQGVQVAEVGGVMNFVRNDAKYVQLAGVGNLVGGSNKGIQAGGVYNVTKNMKGVQLGGVVNVVRDSAGTFQAAGVVNLVGKSFHGLQVAGVLNHTRNVKGVQIAGVLNDAREVSGLQISGLINKAERVKGVQLSVFNFADSCEGVPIGILSFVKHGYHKIEIFGDEIFYTNIAIRTGVKQFHTMLMAGIQPVNLKTPLWHYGYGIGTTFGKEDKLLYDIDISEQQISRGSFNDFTSSLFKIYAGLDKKIAAKVSIAVGLDYNLYISDTKSSAYQEKYASIAPYYISNNTFHNGINMKTWFGAKLALRFL